MWRVVATLAALGLSWPAMAQVFYGTSSHTSSYTVQNYTTNSGTYVQPHYQTNPNSTMSDNYGTMGNFNPYIGSYGSRAQNSDEHWRHACPGALGASLLRIRVAAYTHHATNGVKR